MFKTNLKIFATVLIGATVAQGCRTTDSKTSDTLIECKQAAEDAAHGKILGNFIGMFINPAKDALMTKFPPLAAVDNVTSQVLTAAEIEHDPAALIGKAIGGPGCDLLAAKLDYFINLTERRFSDVFTKIEEVDKENVEVTVITAAKEIRAIIQDLDDDLKVMHNDKPSGDTLNNYLKSGKDNFSDLKTKFDTIATLIRKQTKLQYMAQVYAAAVPLGFTAALLSENFLQVTARSKDAMPTLKGQIYRSIAEYRQSLGDMMWILERKIQNYPGVELELVEVPNLAGVTPPADRSCASKTDFDITFENTRLEFKINVFGKPFGQRLVEVAGNTYKIKLANPFPSCTVIDDHPDYLSALTRMFSDKGGSPVYEALNDVKALHGSMDVEALKKFRDWLHWDEKGTSLPGSYFDGLTLSIPWGSKDRGDNFSDLSHLQKATAKIQLSEISVRVRKRPIMICINVKNIGPICHGGNNDPNAPEKKIYLKDGEYITKVYVSAKNLTTGGGLKKKHYENRVHALKIETNYGQKIEEGDWHNGIINLFEAAPGTAIVGFHGNSGFEIDSLGVITSFAK